MSYYSRNCLHPNGSRPYRSGCYTQRSGQYSSQGSRAWKSLQTEAGVESLEHSRQKAFFESDPWVMPAVIYAATVEVDVHCTFADPIGRDQRLLLLPVRPEHRSKVSLALCRWAYPIPARRAETSPPPPWDHEESPPDVGHGGWRQARGQGSCAGGTRPRKWRGAIAPDGQASLSASAPGGTILLLASR